MMAFLKNIYHYLLAFLGALVYGLPSRKIFVFGVTGTKGKSTTLELINAILEKAGEKTALASSVRFKIAAQSQPNLSSNTMPGRFAIQRFLRQAVRAGCRYAMLEVTSEGVIQHRHRFINFDAVAFLNLHPEHIERHGSFENYRDAKVKFFRDAAQHSGKRQKFFLINKSDPSAGFFEAAVAGRGRLIKFSRADLEKRWRIDKKVNPWLTNDFNLENAAAAVSFTETLGIDERLISQALSEFSGLAGRLEIIQEKPFKVVIDYAHTPESLAKVYQALANPKLQTLNSKLICVLGSAGGGRDKWKRPEFGKIAARYCREIILTNEDPYDENPLAIIEEIESGFSQIRNPNIEIRKILDRREAIKKSLSLAKKGDTVIITGKGSEYWMHLEHGRKIPWNEREAVQQLLTQLSRKS